MRKMMGNDVNNPRPILEILEEVGYDKWKEREVYWINKFRKNGLNLTNVTDGGDNKDKKRVARIDYITNKIEEIYESVADAGRENEYSSNARISDCCNGKVQKSMGYKWRFIDEDDTIIDNSFRVFNSKKVTKLNLELDIIKIYTDIESVKLDGYDSGNVYNVCNGKTRSDKGFIWRFVDEFNNIIPIDIFYKKKTVAKYDLNDNYIKTYLNLESAGDDNGLSSGESIRMSIERSGTSCGYKWKFNNY